MNTIKKEIYLWLVNIDHCRTWVEASWTFDSGLDAIKNALSFSSVAMSEWKRVEDELRATNMATIDGIDVTVFHKSIHGTNMDAILFGSAD